MNRRSRIWLVCEVLLASVVAVLFLPRIPQAANYHVFADARTLFGIRNCLDVISNIPFLLVGILGLRFLLGTGASGEHRFLDSREHWPYLLFFLGVTLVFFGSSYYHAEPGNERLVWDRLPITLAFMALLSAVIAERISVTAGLRSLPPLLIVGTGSVLYWRVTELRGWGDLRFYGIVQFGSLLAILLLLALFPPRYTRSMDFAGALGFYALAKILESLDRQIFSLGHVVSGHALKHLAAALSAYWILRMLKRRNPSTNVV
jgi:hypothetical protein